MLLMTGLQVTDEELQLDELLQVIHELQVIDEEL